MMNLRKAILRTTGVAVLVAALSVLLACAQLPPRAEVPYAAAQPPATSGAIAARVLDAEAAHPGESGFRLVSSGAEAYAIRMYSARDAAQSLDIQTYIWHPDMTGKLLAHYALEAADRGVNVRILVDDMDARAKNTAFAALDAHPNIEVRMFNPLASRDGTIRKVGELATRFRRLNRRMHNKSWIVDNRIGLVGGRNLGNEYFQADESNNFVDLDLLMVGPVVREVSASFDKFWNSKANYPIRQLLEDDVSEDALANLRKTLDEAVRELPSSPYASTLRDDPGVRAILDDSTRLHWTREWTFASDEPLKAADTKQPTSNVLAALRPAVEGATSSVHLISPYFVPGDGGTKVLVGSKERGVDVRILTNSLAANDVAAVHGGYSRYRPTLIAAGIPVWELKPAAGVRGEFSLQGSSGSSLHTKAAVFDARQVFVGSYNLDPRSTSLNTEQGLLVVHPALARELGAIFATETSGARAWRVTLDDGDLRWSDGEKTWTSEPEAGASRKVQAWVSKLLPVEKQL